MPVSPERALKLSLTAALLAAFPAFADQPQPLPYPPAIPAPVDTSWPGTIKLAVDITDLARHIVNVREIIPVQKPGDLVLLYPEWVPGDHGPTGPLNDLAGLVITAGNQPLDWVRDTVNVHAFHVKVPPGATALQLSFQYLSPPSTREGRVEMTPDMVDLAWNTVVLYPAGIFSRGITFEPAITLPKTWHYATALETAATSGNTAHFRPTTLNTLVDSPLYAGQYFSRIDLAPGGATPVHLNVFADRPEDLAITPDQLAKHRAIVTQAVRNFGAQHYKHYDFLFALSSQLGGVGLEHHQSSEDGVDRDYFTDWDKDVADRDLLTHEYTHSWNGKFRRPADLWAPNFNVPERDSLLWVYEGQTQFWGQVLAARSGLWSHQEALDAIADDAASMQAEIGRLWRPLQDTTNDPIINERRPQSWHSWERQEDYYTEGLLIWLDADSLIRQKTQGKQSLTDFAHRFFGMDDGSIVTLPYTFQDVVAALNQVLPYDWAGFLRARLDRKGQGAPLDGITRGGYRLVYTDKPSEFFKSAEGRRKVTDFTWSLGLRVGAGGTIVDVAWNGPAYRAGLVRGGKIIAVNGLSYEDGGDLKSAVTRAKTSQAPIELLVQDDRHFQTVQIVYHDGLRYPHLERVANTPALLDDLLAPLP
jgi:predicted metalloprotease with PDZ domain